MDNGDFAKASASSHQTDRPLRMQYVTDRASMAAKKRLLPMTIIFVIVALSPAISSLISLIRLGDGPLEKEAGPHILTIVIMVIFVAYVLVIYWKHSRCINPISQEAQYALDHGQLVVGQLVHVGMEFTERDGINFVHPCLTIEYEHPLNHTMQTGTIGGMGADLYIRDSELPLDVEMYYLGNDLYIHKIRGPSLQAIITHRKLEIITAFSLVAAVCAAFLGVFLSMHASTSPAGVIIFLVAVVLFVVFALLSIRKNRK